MVGNEEADFIIRTTLVKKTSRRDVLNRISARNRRRIRKITHMRQRGCKCEICGIECAIEPTIGRPSIYSFDFHHLKPHMKRFKISKPPSDVRPFEVEIELAKCILVCSFCHDQIEFNNYTVPEYFFQRSKIWLEQLSERYADFLNDTYL